MSFPIDEQSYKGEPRHLGDIFVCPKTALLYANNVSCTTTDTRNADAAIEAAFWNEVLLYIVHGLLHLLGYDDLVPHDRALMRRREKNALKILKKRNISLCGTLKIKTQF
jgi:probable rRNA maturation factor